MITDITFSIHTSNILIFLNIWKMISRQEIGKTSKQCQKRLAKERQTCFRKKKKIKIKKKKSSQAFSIFSTCCAHKKVSLPLLTRLLSYLLNLYTLSKPNANSFCKNIRCYNNVLAYILFEADIDKFQE